MARTTISWATHNWNCVTGCREVSPGCDNCYARAIAESERFRAAFPNGFDITLHPERLEQPLKMKKPARIFVNSMSDFWHKAIPDDFLLQQWEVMLKADWHSYLILTKRIEVAAARIQRLGLQVPPQIWLGVSVENQRLADQRIPYLLSIPAAVHWVSCEPLLGPLDLRPYLHNLQWVVDGGESGDRRRQAEYDWFRSNRDQCQEFGVPYFHKQGNSRYPDKDRFLDGRLWEEYPQVNTVGQLALV